MWQAYFKWTYIVLYLHVYESGLSPLDEVLTEHSWCFMIWYLVKNWKRGYLCPWLFRSGEDAGSPLRGPHQERRHVLLLALPLAHGRLLQWQHPGVPQLPHHLAGALLLQRGRRPVRPGGDAALHRPLAHPRRERGEPQVEGVGARRPHALPPGGLPPHAGELPQLAAHLAVGARTVSGGCFSRRSAKFQRSTFTIYLVSLSTMYFKILFILFILLMCLSVSTVTWFEAFLKWKQDVLSWRACFSQGTMRWSDDQVFALWVKPKSWTTASLCLLTARLSFCVYMYWVLSLCQRLNASSSLQCDGAVKYI